MTWADCSLRKYLNSEFYSKFTVAEQSRIIPVWKTIRTQSFCVSP
ncbi:DUF6273 domain-containing protein [Anaerocolumna sp. MB42-C2]|nr:DUF6273 domain-containing protein [Anaerocolumna sp. MB42-C2]WMJ86047.1 DUF6273 domain-containing protein [Anaerocolumna sp. MB42-C2]